MSRDHPDPTRVWWLASRPKTLAAAIAPVAVGTALALTDDGFHAPAAFAALIGALLIQVGTNLANDAADYRRGADAEDRLGPTRAVQAGWMDEGTAIGGAAVAFGLALLVGTYLVYRGGWPILGIGLAGILAGILYTWGPLPLAYVGAGDGFVLAFFGVAAVAGTHYVQTLEASWVAVALGVAVGALAVVLLSINNLRDIETDARAGKRTLAVRLGPAATRGIILFWVVLAFAVPGALVAGGLLGPMALLVLVALPAAAPVAKAMREAVEGRALNRTLAAAARLQLAYAAFLSLGVALGPTAG